MPNTLKQMDQVDLINIERLAHILRGIGFKIMILGRLEGGRRTRRTLTTDNASKIFILKPIIMAD